MPAPYFIFGLNPNSITVVFQDITNWKKGTEHINGLELFFKDRDHLIEKWEMLSPDGTKTHFERNVRCRHRANLN